MPVNNNYEIQEYKGNSCGRIYNFPFRCFSLDHLKVELVDSKGSVTELIQNTDYKVTGGLDNSGGMITYPLDVSLPALSSSETIRIYRSTPMEQSIDYPTYQQAIENALDKVTMLLQEAVNDSAVNIANEAIEKVNQILTLAISKTNVDGSNIDKYPFLNALGIGSDGELDLTDFCKTDGSNADVVAFRTLVGMQEVKSDIVEINNEVSELSVSAAKTDGSNITVEEWRTLLGVKDFLAIAPQTIVKGAVGSIPANWKEDWCDKPAKHIEINSSINTSLTIKAGLQVCAGFEGSVVLSKELPTDADIDMKDLPDGKHYIYADLNDANNLSFGSKASIPVCGQQNPAQTQYYEPRMTANTSNGWVATSSGIFSTSYPAYYAFNGSAANEWISTNGSFTNFVGNAWLAIRMVSKVAFPVAGVKLFRKARNSDTYPRDFTIESSDDNWATFTVEKTVVNQPVWTDAPVTVMFDEVSCKKAYRIHITKAIGANSTYVCLGQMTLIHPCENDFYNISNNTHYEYNSNVIKRVYIGEAVITSGILSSVINYQHGTTVTMPVNGGANIGINSIYYLGKPFLGYCTSVARIFKEGKWGKTGWSLWGSSGGYGTQSNITNGVLSVQTGNVKVTGSGKASGGEFTANHTAALAKVTVQRGW